MYKLVAFMMLLALAGCTHVPTADTAVVRHTFTSPDFVTRIKIDADGSFSNSGKVGADVYSVTGRVTRLPTGQYDLILTTEFNGEDYAVSASRQTAPVPPNMEQPMIPPETNQTPRIFVTIEE